MGLKLQPGLSHPPVYARVRSDDYHAGQNESYQKDGFLGGLAVLFENGAGECRRVQAQLTPETQQGRKLNKIHIT